MDDERLQPGLLRPAVPQNSVRCGCPYAHVEAAAKGVVCRLRMALKLRRLACGKWRVRSHIEVGKTGETSGAMLRKGV